MLSFYLRKLMAEQNIYPYNFVLYTILTLNVFYEADFYFDCFICIDVWKCKSSNQEES